MSDIKLIISIPEDEYNIIKKSNAPKTWVEHLIANGTPLTPDILADLLMEERIRESEE